jgi:two-component system sensor kinase FixL
MAPPFNPATHPADLLAALIEASGDAIAAIDLDGTIVSWSAGAARLYGYTADEAVGRSIGMLNPDGPSASADELARLQAGHKGVQSRVVRRTADGRTVEVLHVLAPVRDASGTVTGAVSVDRDLRGGTEREDAAGEGEARWQAVINSAVDAIVTITDRGRIETFNPAAERLFGYSAPEVLGRNVSTLMPAPYRDEHDGYLARYLREGEARIIGIGREVTGQRRDGSTFPLHLSVGELAFGGERKFVGILHDLTERVRMEVQLREQSALARLGEMAAVLAHEIKNPLAGIRGAIQVIGGRLPRGSAESGITQEIVVRIDALSALMRDLLLFARPPQPRLALVEMAALVASTVDLLRQDPALVDVEVAIAGTAPPIQADAELLKIVILNLLINGAHAMQGRGTLSVVVSDGGHSCLIAVSDQGPGIPPDIREKIFTPFFTTKARGSGLGLPTARQLVDAHGGDIRITCPEAGGTIVTVELPARR